MSELVERVKIALREVPDINGVTDAEGEARAAIAAVAEWLDNSHKLDDDSRVSLALSKQLEAKE
jgi:hypothetical protein